MKKITIKVVIEEEFKPTEVWELSRIIPNYDYDRKNALTVLEEVKQELINTHVVPGLSLKTED